MSNATSLFASAVSEAAGDKREMGVDNGRVKVFYDTVTMDYDYSTDTFESGYLPVGAKIVDAYVKGPAKTTGIFDLGYTGTLDAFVKSCNLDADATRFKRADALSTGLNTALTARKQILLTATEAATVAEGDGTIIEIAVFYVMD